MENSSVANLAQIASISVENVQKEKPMKKSSIANEDEAYVSKGISAIEAKAPLTDEETFPFMQYPVSILTEGVKGVFKSAANVVCNVSGGCLRAPAT